MWSRRELKEKAKAAFKRNYWKCVLVAFILVIVTGTGSFNITNIDTDELLYNEFKYDLEEYETNEFIGDELDALVDSGLAKAGMVFMGIIVILDIFFINPLEVGGCYFFTTNALSPANAGELIAGFKDGRYFKSVKTIFLRDLYIVLWSLLFIIPGIIKSYEYRMVSYLLADQPSLSRKEAFLISKEMMRGQKMDAFILDLSFFWWYLLTACTCGLAGIFYVTPYVHATNAELYLALRDQYFYERQSTARRRYYS